MDDYKGLKWYKCDFHLHTMTSKCYKNQDDTVEEWVARVKEQGLQCIAITDHNNYKGIDEVKRVCEENGIIAFPGVELTCGDKKCHLLVLFDSEKDGKYVYTFMIQLGLNDESEYGTQDIRVDDITLSQICEVAHKNNGIVIAAHIDEYNGLCEIDKSRMRTLLSGGNIDAVQVANKVIWKGHTKNYNYELFKQGLEEKYFKNKGDFTEELVKKWHDAYRCACDSELPLLTFSDNPSESDYKKHGLDGIGKNFTWIKMNDKPNLESVKQAFQAKDVRIMDCIDSDYKEPNVEPQIWIKSITVQGTVLNEFDGNEETPIKAEFNPQLNTIIGGRGSGKSSIIRFLAGGLRSFNGDGMEEIAKEQNSFYKINDKGAGVFNKNSKNSGDKLTEHSGKVKIELVRNGELYIIEASSINSMFEQHRTIFEVDDSTGELVNVSEEKIGANNSSFNAYKADIFTQKQVYELARNSQAFLGLIDEQDKEIKELIEERDELINQIIKNGNSEEELSKKIYKKGELESKYKDINTKLEKLGKGEYSDIQDKPKYESDKDSFDKYLKLKNTKGQEVLDFLSKKIEELNVEHTINNDEIKGMVDRDCKVLVKQLEDIKSDIQTNISESNATLKEDLKNTDWKKKYNQICVKSEELRQKGIDFGDYNKLINEIGEVNSQLEAIRQKENELEELKEKLKDIQKEYNKKCDEIRERRKASVRKVMGDDKSVQFEILAYSDKEDFMNMILELLQIKPEAQMSVDVGKMVDWIYMNDVREINQPKEFKKSLRRYRENIQAIRDGIQDNDNNEDISEIGKKVSDKIRDLNMGDYYHLLYSIPNDLLRVKYRVDSTGKYKSLDYASAGEKTTAMLTFLVSVNDRPLILDQPEDDLDNRLVYDLIVKRLRAIKQKRQVIVVTHNANIPVNADAEYIISMDSESEKVKVKASGTIDDDNIRQEICDVMEGSTDAFLKRANKYHLDI